MLDDGEGRVGQGRGGTDWMLSRDEGDRRNQKRRKQCDAGEAEPLDGRAAAVCAAAEPAIRVIPQKAGPQRADPQTAKHGVMELF